MFSKKNMMAIVITILMMILLSNLFAFTSTTYNPKYGITTDRLNFRKAANQDSSSFIRTLSLDTKLKIVGEIDNFYIVQLENNEVGVISKDFAKIEGSSLPNALTYETVTPYYATIRDNGTNLRAGPGTTFASYGKLNSGTRVQVIGKIQDFNLIVTEDNKVGMVRNDLITKEDKTPSTPSTPSTPNVSDNQQLVLKLMNDARKAQGLPALQIDSLLDATAQSKARDMVENNYFSHTSPTYGSPFEMMQNAGITYKAAGENIAGNPSIEAAVKSWLDSESHRKNILSSAYNYVGIGIEKSDVYGYVIVAMFIGK